MQVTPDVRKKMKIELPEVLDTESYQGASYVNERVLTVLSFFRLWAGRGMDVEGLLNKLYAGLIYLQRRALSQPDKSSSYGYWLDSEIALRLVRTWVYEIPFWMRCVYTVLQTSAMRKDKDDDRAVLQKLYVIMKERQMERLVYYSSRHGSNLFYTHRSEESRKYTADWVPKLTTSWLAALRYEMKILGAVPSEAGDFQVDNAAYFRVNSRLDLDESVFRSVHRIAEWSSIGLPYWIALEMQHYIIPSSEQKAGGGGGDGGAFFDASKMPRGETIGIDPPDFPMLMKWRELLREHLVEWQMTNNPDKEVRELEDIFSLFQDSDRLTAYRELSEKLRDFLNNQLLNLETQLYGENKEQSKSRKNLRVAFEEEVLKIVAHGKRKPRPDEATRDRLSKQLGDSLLNNGVFRNIQLEGKELGTFRERLTKLLWTANSQSDNAELRRLLGIAERAIEPLQRRNPKYWGNFKRLKEQLLLRNEPTRRELDEQRRLLLQQARERLRSIERDESSVISRLAWHEDDTLKPFAFRSSLTRRARDEAGLTEEDLRSMTPATRRGSLYDAVRVYEEFKKGTRSRPSEIYRDISDQYGIDARARLIRNMTQLAQMRGLMDRLDDDGNANTETALTSRKWMRRYTEFQPPWLLLDEDDAKQRIRDARQRAGSREADVENRLAFEPLQEDSVLSHYVETLRAFDMSVYVAGMFNDLTDAVASMMDLLGHEGGENIDIRDDEKAQHEQDLNTAGKVLWDYAENRLPSERRPDEQYTAYVRGQLEENLVRVMNWLATAQEVKANLIECVLPYLDELFEGEREQRRLVGVSRDTEDLSDVDIQRIASASTRRAFVRETTIREEEDKDGESDDQSGGDDDGDDDNVPPPLAVNAILASKQAAYSSVEERKDEEMKSEVVINIGNLTINNVNPRRLKLPGWREQEQQQDDSEEEEQPDDEKKDDVSDNRRYPRRQIAPAPLRTADDVQQGATATRRNYRRPNTVQDQGRRGRHSTGR